MNIIQQQVREFHETFGHPVAEKPGLVSREVALARIAWMQEELDELRDAVDAGDLTEIFDAIGDLEYFVQGTALVYGMDTDKIIPIIHASNMSKLGEDGKPITRADGKSQKGPNFFEPQPVIAEHIREALES